MHLNFETIRDIEILFLRSCIEKDIFW